MPPVPTGDASLTLAEGEVEVARGTAVTRGSLEAHPAGALARVLVTVTVQHSGAGTLARCGRGGRRGQSRAGCLCPWGQGRGGAGLTLAVGAVEARGAELTVVALEVGFAQAASRPRVPLAGVVLGPGGIAVTVCRWVREGVLRGPADPASPPPTSLRHQRLPWQVHSA